MEDTNVSSAEQLNDLEPNKIAPIDMVKLSNGRLLSNDQKFYPGKTMHVMTPGPKTYSSNKKSPDKELKFVPYEPYKAAVRSIVPELSQPSAIFKRRLSTSSNCSKLSNKAEEKEDMITILSQEKQVIVIGTYFCLSIFYYLPLTTI